MSDVELANKLLALVNRRGKSDFEGWHSAPAWEIGELLNDARRIIHEATHEGD